MKSIFLQHINIHNNWKPFLSKEILDLIIQAELEISKNEFTPSAEKTLRFFELPLHSVKVVILGQDPYPQVGAATGRAFEVGNLKSWNEPFRNISLKNILRALFKVYSGKILKYSELKEKFDNEFPVLSPTKLFKHWENQGALLLNTAFTCEPGKPASHSKVWKEFSFELLTFINNNSDNLTWILWGNHALEATKDLEIKNTIISQHPMMCYERPERKNDFLFGNINCFEQLKNEIDWTGFSFQKEFKSIGRLF